MIGCLRLITKLIALTVIVLIVTLVINSILFFATHLSFKETSDGDRIEDTNLYYKKVRQQSSSMLQGITKILDRKNRVVPIDIQDNDLKSFSRDYLESSFDNVATIKYKNQIFLVTTVHTTGSGEYDDHLVFKIFADKIMLIGKSTSCDQEVKVEKNQIIFTVYRHHCDYFEFDREIDISKIELK